MKLLEALSTVVLDDLRDHRVTVAVGIAIGVGTAFSPLIHPRFHFSRELLAYFAVVALIYYGRAREKASEGQPARGGAIAHEHDGIDY